MMARCRWVRTAQVDLCARIRLMNDWTFDVRAGEPVLDRWIRCFEELLSLGAISITVHAERLRAFLDVISTPGQPVAYIGGHPVSDIATWRTNCAMTQHAAMAWCKRQGMHPFNNGEAITGDKGYLELTKGDVYWVANDGKASPQGPCVFSVAPSARLPYDHVGAFGPLVSGRVYKTYEGGGGDGTHIGASTRDLDKLDSYGRRIDGWWEISPLLPMLDAQSDFSGPMEPASS